MDGDVDDIFGKIDALLGKRIGLTGAVARREVSDFPVLTEVVEALPGEREAIPPDLGHAQLSLSREADTSTLAWPEIMPDARQTRHDEPTSQAAEAPEVAGHSAQEDDIPATAETTIPPMPAVDWDSRLDDRLDQIEARLETMVRRVVREELERWGNS